MYVTQSCTHHSTLPREKGLPSELETSLFGCREEPATVLPSAGYPVIQLDSDTNHWEVVSDATG
jgi:hypothetical protein